MVKKRLPDRPTLPAIRTLLRAPRGEDRQVKAAYVVPTVLIGMLDCIVDESFREVDAAQHLDALGIRPVWRTIPADMDGAARTLVSRLRNISEPSCLVVLYGRPRTQARDGAPSSAGDSGRERAVDGSANTDSASMPVAAAKTDDPSADAPAALPPTTQGRERRRPRTAGPLKTSGVPSADDFIPIAQPCVLSLPPSACKNTVQQSAEHPPHAAPGSAAPGTAPATVGPSPDLDDDSLLALHAAAQRAASMANRIVTGGPSAPPLKSQHHLPTKGNWVRLAAGQQYPVRRAAETARRHSAAGFQSFGNEPRLSASRRWAHQTTSGQLQGGGAIPVTSAGGAAAGPGGPGSFLPLKACASMLHAPRKQTMPRSAFMREAPLAELNEP